MSRPASRLFLLSMILLGVQTAPLRAQSPLRVGSWGEEMMRTRLLASPESLDWPMFRSSSLWAVLDAESRLSSVPSGPLVSPVADHARRHGPQGIAAKIILPEATIVWNSRLPFSFNDGSLWAGRGLNVLLSGGVAVSLGFVTLRLSPEITMSQNLGFETIPTPDSSLSPFASPFHSPPRSLDLPTRFGNETLTRWELGQTALIVRLGPFAAGVGSENLWWGPGLRNALMMSNHAPGFPHMFFRSEGPLASPLGKISFQWVAGTLVESMFFDRDPKNDLRSFSGIVLAFSPGKVTGLTGGVARTVVAPLEKGELFAKHALDGFLRWDRRPSPGEVRQPASSDPLLGWFLHWVHRASGVEVWGEWTRMDPWRSLEEFLEAPTRAQASLWGLQWVGGGDQSKPRPRVQVEFTNLEQTRNTRTDPFPLDFYSGQAAPQGYTHRGQVLGAAIGPGSSSQWLAFDMVAPTFRWQVGIFAERIRWHNDALYRQVRPNQFRHDVSLRLGVRGGFELQQARVSLEASGEERLNFLFQNGMANPGGFRTVDVRNYRLSCLVSLKEGL